MLDRRNVGRGGDCEWGASDGGPVTMSLSPDGAVDVLEIKQEAELG